VREDAGITRGEIVGYLEANNIQTRMLFAGNMIKQPCFDEIRPFKHRYRVIGGLKNTDRVLKNAFWVGFHCGLNHQHLDYIVATIRSFVNKIKKW
jgi:CDP-6-deoxy-D-xylo-4-hexulose-3-dehydrase